MAKKLHVAILFGGKSAEHEVSIRSAKNVCEALTEAAFPVIPIGIDKKGNWFVSTQKSLLDETVIIRRNGYEPVTLLKKDDTCVVFSLVKNKVIDRVDIVFPVLHGPYGEDGSMQGLLKVLGVPFVGPGVLGSAVGMDKDIAKRLFRDAGISSANFLVYTNAKQFNFLEAKKKLGSPLFIKPANLGSSVGVSKVGNAKEFLSAIKHALQFDSKILIEEYIQGREIECSVLGNEEPKASIPGEITPTHEFYDYSAKYIDENGAKLVIPAKLSKTKLREVQQLACKAFTTLCLEGMARVDFFLTPKGTFYLNEVNTIPGFTNISMYPKLWEKSGISDTELVWKLIQLAQERFHKEKKLKATV